MRMKAFLMAAPLFTSLLAGCGSDQQTPHSYQPVPIAQQPAAFVDKGDGTIYERATNLTWLKDAGCFGGQTWDQAVDLAKNLADGKCGLSDGSKPGDWSLPGSFDARHVVNTTYDPLFTSFSFYDKNGDPVYYWTSDNYNSSATSVKRGSGAFYSWDKSHLNYALPVKNAVK